MSRNESVPGASSQGVDMDTGAGTGGTHDEPAVGRSLPLARVTKEIVDKEGGHFEIIE